MEKKSSSLAKLAQTGRQLLLFLLDDVLQANKHFVFSQRSESEARASRLDGRDDLGQVVADDAEARVFGELFENFADKTETRQFLE